MNVNLTPSVDNSKVTNVTKSAQTSDLVSSDSGETKGFLDKLASLLLGNKGEGEVKQSEGKAESKVTDESVIQSADVESAEDSSVDAILAQGDESPEIEGSADQSDEASSDAKAQAKGDSGDVEIPENLKAFIASDDEEQTQLKAKTAQAMDDGDKILGRLQEANQTLVNKDGKPLPRQEKVMVESDTETAAVIKNAINPDDVVINNDSAEPVSQETLAAVNAGLVDKKNVEHKQVLSSAEQLELSNVESLKVTMDNNAELPDDHPVKQAKNAKETQALSDSQIAAILAKQPKTGMQQAGELNQNPEQADQLAPTVAAAIPWASGNNSETVTMNSVDLDGKGPVKATPHGAQPAHQASQPQQVMTQMDKAVTAQVAMPGAVSTETVAQPQPQPINMQANPMLSAAMAKQVDPTVSQAALKAGIGAKALAGLSDGQQKGQAADSNFAQQLSAAAGQQGASGPQGLRSDGLQAQQASSPLQMARSDAAANELAERVQVMLSKNLKNIDIRLDPPELGRMHIRMNMNSEGATVHFTVANQHARDALEQSMPRLREMLNNQGVQLGDTSVQQQSSGQQQRYASGGDGSGAGGQSASNDHLSGEENLDTNVKLDLNVASKRDGISYYA